MPETVTVYYDTVSEVLFKSLISCQFPIESKLFGLNVSACFESKPIDSPGDCLLIKNESDFDSFDSGFAAVELLRRTGSVVMHAAITQGSRNVKFQALTSVLNGTLLHQNKYRFTNVLPHHAHTLSIDR